MKAVPYFCNEYTSLQSASAAKQFFPPTLWPDSRSWPPLRGYAITPDTLQSDRVPLDEWSARRTDLYLTAHNNQKTQTCMTPRGISKRAAADFHLQFFLRLCDRASWQILIIKPTRCTNFSNLFWRNAACFGQFLCPSSGVFHCIHRIRMFHPDSARKPSTNLYDMYHCCMYSEKLLMMDRGTVWIM